MVWWFPSLTWRDSAVRFSCLRWQRDHLVAKLNYTVKIIEGPLLLLLCISELLYHVTFNRFQLLDLLKIKKKSQSSFYMSYFRSNLFEIFASFIFLPRILVNQFLFVNPSLLVFVWDVLPFLDIYFHSINPFLLNVLFTFSHSLAITYLLRVLHLSSIMLHT